MKHVLQWHITHKCNLRCKHCYQEEYNSDLDFEKLKSIFNQYLKFLEYFGYKGHINFTGGEPFLYKDIFKLFDLCKENNITFGILTNGTLLDKNYVNALKLYKNLSFVQVSIDGTKKTHDSIRGNGNFDKALKGLKNLRKAKIQTMVSFTCHKYNYKELKDVISIVKKQKIDRFWTDRLIPIDLDKEVGKNMILNDEEFNEVLFVLRTEKRISEMDPFCKTKIHMNRALQFCEGESIYQCSAGDRLLTILANGDILPCRRLPVSFGNLLNDNMLELYINSNLIEDLMKKEIPEDCKGCSKSEKCRGGAKCLNYALFNTYKKKDYNCNFGKEDCYEKE